LEDFPTHHDGEEAHSLLACWSALWHPALIASAAAAPTWRRVDDPPQELAGRLMVLPTMSASRLPTGYAQRAKEEGAVLIRKTTSREEIVRLALAGLDEVPTIDAELAADFLALGFTFLTVQLLTRQTRYATNLDEPFFRSQVVAAAEAAMAGDAAASREKLSVCFNLLAEERDHFFPVDVTLLELILVAPTTLGPHLRQELSAAELANVLIAPEVVRELAAKEPETLATLRETLAAERVALVGGGEENRWPLTTLESMIADLSHGIATYEEHLGRRPIIFGRRRFGMTSHVAGLLQRLGFVGALHQNWEDGTVPEGTQQKVRWESLDGRAIDALARPPLDASLPQTFLQLPAKLGEVLDSESAPVLCFAHWPQAACEWLGDVRRAARYGRALGEFQTVEHYFSHTATPGQMDRFEPDQYKSPYLKQAIIRREENPISASVAEWREAATSTATDALRTLATTINVAGTLRVPTTDADDAFSSAANELAAALTGKPTTDAASAAGFLILNPFTHVKRMGVELPPLSGLPAAAKPIYAVGNAREQSHVVVDVPGQGFVWIPKQNAASAAAKDRPLVENNVLRNEFFEAVINPVTGALSAVRDYNARGNRLSQQLALRMPGGGSQKPGDVYRDPDETAVYTVMGADSLETTIATSACGEIVVRGRLMDLSGKRLASFVQTYRLWRGSRVLLVDIELDPLEEPKADPWNSYYCARLAWAEEGADLYRGYQQTRVLCGNKRIEAPQYLEIAAEKHRTAIFTSGLPFHRRHEYRMLDTLLITRGEKQRKFRLGIGVDVSHPQLESWSLLAPPCVVPCAAPPASGNSGWLFHLDARQVAITHWEPITAADGSRGVRLRLLETEGRGAKAKLTAYRAFKSARVVELNGDERSTLTVDGDAVRIELGEYEFQQIECLW
jgi:alpha-mannosidase